MSFLKESIDEKKKLFYTYKDNFIMRRCIQVSKETALNDIPSINKGF